MGRPRHRLRPVASGQVLEGKTAPLTSSAPISSWLGPSELRIGLGCMRLGAERALETISAALESGITVFDTARAYEGNEQIVAAALAGSKTAHIVTKGGMSRPDGNWIPDGRAKAILGDCEASLEALAGLTIDLYLLHAPDPRTPWRTSVRALARLVDEGLVKRVGVCNVNRAQLDEALDLAPIAAVQVALSVLDDHAFRGGVVERCEQAGITLMAHSPLGGPRRARSVERQQALRDIGAARGVSPAEVALAWLLRLSPLVLPIPGARRPETARSAAAAAGLALSNDDVAAIDEAFGWRKTAPSQRAASGEVVVVMGIPGAGKSRVAQDYVGRGYARLNRDERGGSLRDLAGELDARLASGAGAVVLDNTYLTRAVRSFVIEAALAHGIRARCVWLDTPLAQAQCNVVERMLDRFGELPGPDEMKKLERAEPGVVITPTSQMRTVRELESPSEDEGWDAVERVTFTRSPRAGVSGVLVAAPVLDRTGWEHELTDRDAPHLVYDWRPDETEDALADAVERLRAHVGGPIDGALCPHGGGPPRCWCRPPLPGLPLAFARRYDVDLSHSTLIGCRPAHRTLADTLGARYVNA